ncbi:tyrosine-type recombinase/integrase [Streptomyces sp. NBC_00582]|uniref:tyrosine-type recombinase/integrase n=1 Tax=Streptomyces sp. NBC_00582 TaxID=2975783 RepID=UPI002E8199D7|nr:site-specific integrase [Streptomyces sp. NBC_00582]WUB64482.1 site-specific integrase [Streptomyces sp. NBC_00582]
MASIVERPQKSGAITFQVKWREDGEWQNEKFGDDDPAVGRAQAEQFKALVEAHGNRWPHGWVPGQGFVETPAVPGDVPLVDYASRYVRRLNGVDGRTKDDYERDIRLHLSQIQHTNLRGQVEQATIGNLIQEDVDDWVAYMNSGERDPEDPEKWLRAPADPKSIRNRHGLLYCVVQAAIDATPQLRTKNCCTRTQLPRADDHIKEEMTFLEHDEYQRIAQEFTDPDARLLADWLVGTGMRWGEASALQVRDLSLNADIPTANIQRAWKRAPKGSPESFYLGPPKTKKARRLVALTPSQAAMVRELVAGQPPEAYVFRTATGLHWRHSNYYHRKWQPAVKAAVEKGLPKRPRLHDLRHTHVAWLIGRKIPLPAIQARLGHESIQTTVDRYGHLVRELDAEIITALEDVMAGPAPVSRLTRVV